MAATIASACAQRVPTALLLLLLMVCRNAAVLADDGDCVQADIAHADLSGVACDYDTSESRWLCSVAESGSPSWVRVYESTDGGESWQLETQVDTNAHGLCYLRFKFVASAGEYNEYSVKRVAWSGGDQAWDDTYIMQDVYKNQAFAFTNERETAVLVWSAANDGSFDIYADASTNGGFNWNGPSKVGSLNGDDEINPALACSTTLSSAETPTCLLAFVRLTDDGGGAASNLYYMASGDGVSWPSVETLLLPSLSAGSVAASQPYLAAMSSAEFMLVFHNVTDSTNNYVVTRNGTFGGAVAQRIPDGVCDTFTCEPATLTFDEAGDRLIAAWTTVPHNDSVLYASYTEAAGEWGTVARPAAVGLDTSLQHRLPIRVFSGGGMVLGAVTVNAADDAASVRLDCNACENPNPCDALAGGTCELTGGGGGGSGYVCRPCLPDPCVHGECAEIDGGEAFFCYCAEGWEGARCESSVNDCLLLGVDCQHGGVCVDAHRNATCDCGGTGWTGANCEVELNPSDGVTDGSGGSGASAGAIAGGVVGGVAALACVGGARRREAARGSGKSASIMQQVREKRANEKAARARRAAVEVATGDAYAVHEHGSAGSSGSGSTGSYENTTPQPSDTSGSSIA